MSTKDKIYAKIRDGQATTAKELAAQLQVSRAYIHRAIHQLQAEGLVLSIGKTRQAHYIVPLSEKMVREAKSQVRHLSLRLQNIGLAEDLVFNRVERETGIMDGVGDNVVRIVRYAFTEMLNNAIDHSQSKQITVDIRQTSTAITFTIRDYGIGAFANVQKKLRLPSALAAIQEILKGKTTTLPDRHSGQGIFFTSKAADLFVLDSHAHRLTVNNLLPDLFVTPRAALKGTRVQFAINIRSKKQLINVFEAFTSEERGDFAFSKTRISIKLYQFGKDLLSRSEAKRVTANLEHFREIELDFHGVETIGQAFADELFRVWQTAHPDSKLIPTEANDIIRLMIQRAGGPV